MKFTDWFERLLVPAAIIMGLSAGGLFAYALSLATKTAGGGA
jgi:hypothetical protein